MQITLGRSVEGRPIEGHICGPRSGLSILVCGGFHGDEPKSVFVARRLVELLHNDSSPASTARWLVIPVVNPDGYHRRKRRNANGVDLNRNFPTKNWTRGSPRSRMFGGVRPASEPETGAVIKAVNRVGPDCIISIHSISDGRECNNYNGPARALATAMSRRNGYPVRASMGYPTPGSFGTWAGAERHIPTITLELPSHHSPKRCWEDNRGAILLYAGRESIRRTCP